LAVPLDSRVPKDSDSEDDTVAFVQTAINSVCALELLILLRRERQRVFRADQLVRELRSSQLAVAQALEHLAKSGLIEEIPGSGYHYQQVSAQLDAICDRLESDYAHKPVKIVRAILEAPDEKLRTFADAFRLSGKIK
jgi:biotin operon repressor